FRPAMLAATGPCRKAFSSASIDSVFGTPALLKLGEAFAVDLAHPCRRHVGGRVDLLDPQRRLVLVEVLALEASLLVVGPDERLQRMDQVEAVVLVDPVPELLQLGAGRHLMEPHLVGNAPVGDRDEVARVPQHDLADARVEVEYALAPGDLERLLAPGDVIDRVIGHHVGRGDLLEHPGTLEMDVAAEVLEDRAVQRVLGAVVQRDRRIHAAVDFGFVLAGHELLSLAPRLAQPRREGKPWAGGISHVRRAGPIAGGASRAGSSNCRRPRSRPAPEPRRPPGPTAPPLRRWPGRSRRRSRAPLSWRACPVARIRRFAGHWRGMREAAARSRGTALPKPDPSARARPASVRERCGGRTSSARPRAPARRRTRPSSPPSARRPRRGPCTATARWL